MSDSLPPEGSSGQPSHPGTPPPLGGRPYESDAYAESESWRFDETTITLLRQTRPWVMLLAILGFIGTALMVVAGAIMIGAGSQMANDDEMGMVGGAMMGVYYVAMAAIYFFMSLFMYRYASYSSRFAIDPSTQLLNKALEAQRSYWRLVGIIALVCLVLAVLGLVLAVLFAVGAN